MRRLRIGSLVLLCAVVTGMGCGGEPEDRGGGAALGSTESALCSAGGLGTSTKFFVPDPDSGAAQQVKSLLKSRHLIDAARMTAMLSTPQAVWFTDGTPQDVRKAVKKTMTAAALERRLPVLVAYDVPFRDCAQYSAGGAVDTASYEAWIDGFAAGIGSSKAVVVLEPDSLGIIPYHINLDGSADWCKPTVTDAQGNTVPAPGADPATRYAQLNYAVDRLAKSAPNALVYLDGVHSAWLNVGEAASRLSQAGVARTQGFFMNISNYQFTADLAQYGSWISACLAYATSVTPGDFGSCPNQYWNGGPLPSKIAQINGEWNGVALDPSGEWSDSTNTVALNTSGINLRYANMLGATAATAHFIIDTSRNAHGPLVTAPYAAAPYNQSSATISVLNGGNWCNPPGAGLGLRPTANTGVPLLDAYLWVKIPGESDGSCDIAGGARAWDYTQYDPWNITGDAQNHFDPLWGMVDPAAGDWFSQQALQLTQLASPSLL
jgi:endoglucanase